MKLRWTILLLVVNLILLAIFVRQCSHPASLRSFEQLSRNFLPIESETWDEIEVARGDTYWRVARDRWGQWWLKSPMEWPARSDRMARFLGALLSLKVESSFSVADLKRVGQTLRSYGLEVPQAQLTVSNSERTLRYSIGSITPLGGKLYVLSPDKREIWIVDGSLNEYIRWSADQLRQERFYPFEVAELLEINLNLPGRSDSFDRQQKDDWVWMYQGVPTALRKGAVDRFVSQLGALKVNDFKSLDVDQQGLRLPYGRITFRMLYGRHSLLLGKMADAENRWAQWEGTKTVFRIPVSILDGLSKDVLLPNHPFDFDVEKTHHLQANLPSGEWEISRNEQGEWMAADRKLDSDSVMQFLLNLLSAQGSGQVENFSVSDFPYLIKIDTLSNPVYLSKDLSVAAADGIVYHLEQPLGDTAIASLWDKRFLPDFNTENLVLTFKRFDTQSLLTLSPDMPEFSAIKTLLKDPKVASWKTDSFPASAYQLHLTDGEKTADISLANTDEGVWLGQTAKGSFELTQPWGAFLDALCQIRAQ